jgi:hypothetical protein
MANSFMEKMSPFGETELLSDTSKTGKCAIQSEISPSHCLDSSISRPRDHERIKMKKNRLSISLPDFAKLTGEDSTITSLRTSRYLNIKHSDSKVSAPPPQKFSPTLSAAGFSRSRSAGFYTEVDPSVFRSVKATTSDRNLSIDSVAEGSEFLHTDDLDRQGTLAVFQEWTCVADEDSSPPEHPPAAFSIASGNSTH